jgi:hypothetical protein
MEAQMRIAVLAQSLGGRAVEIGEWIARCPAQDIQPVVGSSSMDAQTLNLRGDTKNGPVPARLYRSESASPEGTQRMGPQCSFPEGLRGLASALTKSDPLVLA